MADYTPLIARAVDGLENNTGENRRVLYERARAALVAQLRSIEPALDEGDITGERLALEDAIRKVEADAAKRNREAQTGNGDEAPSAPPPPASPQSLTNQALQGFRDNVAEAEGLGDAAAQASKAARTYYDAVPGGGSDPAHDQHGEQPETLAGAESDAAGPAAEPAPFEPGMAEDPMAEPLAEVPPARHFDDAEEETYRAPRRSYRGLVTTLIILLLLGGLGAAGYWQRAQLVALANKGLAMVTAMRTPAPAPPPPRDTPSAQPKITDRVGAPADQTPGTKPSAAPAADVAQKVVLYEEDSNNPQGKRYVGSAIWRTETVSPGPGLAPELAIRADVEIPERKMRMTWSLRRNTDKALPASHTIEIMFTLPADFSEGGIQNVPGVLMKQNEQTRGVPLAGLAVKVTNGFFLIGLNAVDVDMQRNIALLKERPWFDIPIVYNNNKRAILAVEKGTPGERAFDEAFRAWGQ
jgi:hypothetical protein